MKLLALVFFTFLPSLTFASNDKVAASLVGNYQATDTQCKWPTIVGAIVNAEDGPALCFQNSAPDSNGPCFYINSKKRKYNSYGHEGRGHSIVQQQTLWEGSKVTESFRDCWNGVFFHVCPKWQESNSLTIMNENEIRLRFYNTDCIFKKI